MTEEEAKTKWCPFARVASPLRVIAPGSTVEQWVGIAGANRAALSDRVGAVGADDHANPESARCIGSACMAWRVKEGFEPSTLAHMAAAGHPTPAPEGHCGLAGAPQP